MYLKRQSFLVFGLSKSGKAAAEFLLAQGATTYLYDESQNPRVQQILDGLTAIGGKPVGKEELAQMPNKCDGLVISPGIPIDHPVAVAFKRSGKAVLGETELAARHVKTPVVAVTGTNGKTTTVSMLADVLSQVGEAWACGNIGAPMLNFVEKTEGIAVAEISSFQLETLQSLRPHVAVILNVTEDHLNRHYTMENYLFLKEKLLKNLTACEYAVLNYDDERVRAFAEKTKAKTLYFSVRQRVVGAFYEDGFLWFGKEKILAAAELPCEGVHNIQNALAVIAVAKIMGVPSRSIADALKNFRGIPHRVQAVGEADGVLFVNDSKGTNVDATLKAVAAMGRDTVLMLGGKHKGYDYGKLFSALKNSRVKACVLYGENRFSLLSAAREVGFEPVTVCQNFDFAFRVATLIAKSGQTVLLSPASASFDEFSGYEERGERFMRLVADYQAERSLPPVQTAWSLPMEGVATEVVEIDPEGAEDVGDGE